MLLGPISILWREEYGWVPIVTLQELCSEIANGLGEDAPLERAWGSSKGEPEGHEGEISVWQLGTRLNRHFPIQVASTVGRLIIYL